MEQETEEGLVDVEGRPVEGPTSYDNVDERGEVLYLDEERRRRKERPDKPLFRNHGNGLGIKNFLVSHLSTREWNWNIILALFNKIVSWSRYLKEPDSMRGQLYKRGMYFGPEETTYTSGVVCNFDVDAEEALPGTAAYNEARRAERKAGEEQVAGEPAGEEVTAGEVGPEPTEPADEPAEPEPDEHREAFACKQEAAAGAGAASASATIPVGQVVSQDAGRDYRSVTVPMDLVKKAIDEAEYIGGMKKCLCRSRNDCQDYPQDLGCLFLNLGGKVVVDHGIAVELTREEAYERVDRAAELGLVCQSLWVEVEQLVWGLRNDQMNSFIEICFCCPCCCVGFNVSKNGTRDVMRRFSPSGWTAVVDHDKCVGCRKCLDDYCPQDAIHFRASDGKMVVDQENCVGCGFCRSRCPEGAIQIKQTMPMRDSVYDYLREEGRLEIVPGL